MGKITHSNAASSGRSEEFEIKSVSGQTRLRTKRRVGRKYMKLNPRLEVNFEEIPRKSKNVSDTRQKQLADEAQNAPMSWPLVCSLTDKNSTLRTLASSYGLPGATYINKSPNPDRRWTVGMDYSSH